MKSLVTLALALLTFPTLAAAQPCSPDTWTSDPAGFEHLEVEDFQAYPLGNWANVPESDPVVVGSAGLWGSLWATTGWCIPGMDNGGTCGGDNVYLASAVDLHITPVEPFSQIGFRYGTQGQNFYIEITLSDGSVHLFNPQQLHPNGWGGNENYGFFGYCTGDDSLTIEYVQMWGGDGGIDDLRTGDSGTGGCSLDDLAQTITDLGLGQNKAHPLVQKVAQTQMMLAKDKPCQAINALDQLAHKVIQWRAKFIPTADADALLECIDAIIAELEPSCPAS